MTIVRVLSNTEVLTANSSVRNAKLVRLLATTPAQVNVFDVVSNSQIGSIVLAPNIEICLEKKGTDVLSSNASVFAVGVAYRD